MTMQLHACMGTNEQAANAHIARTIAIHRYMKEEYQESLTGLCMWNKTDLSYTLSEWLNGLRVLLLWFIIIIIADHTHISLF